MRILYGVQGTGNGHISRARVMEKALKKAGVEVDFLFSGRASNQYFDMGCFSSFSAFEGLTLVSELGKVNVLETLKQNLSSPILKHISELDLSGYDLVLNDFEPISAWAAKRQKIPSIGISHQAALLHGVPKQGVSWFDEVLLNHFAPVDIALGCHWHHFGFPILPPFVEVQSCERECSHQILVYLPFEDADTVADFFAPFSDYEFFIYHRAKPIKPLPEHLHWFGFSHDGFKAHMAQCGGVIGNAGFELASEALTLGKKLLVKPLKGQFEQAANVAALELLAAARSMEALNSDVLRRWLKAAPPKAIAYPRSGDSLASWLAQGDWGNVQGLCDDVWSTIALPDNWRS
jgi:uncharacterized protein (TIGR00661 family)